MGVVRDGFGGVSAGVVCGLLLVFGVGRFATGFRIMSGGDRDTGWRSSGDNDGNTGAGTEGSSSTAAQQQRHQQQQKQAAAAAAAAAEAFKIDDHIRNSSNHRRSIREKFGQRGHANEQQQQQPQQGQVVASCQGGWGCLSGSEITQFGESRVFQHLKTHDSLHRKF
jgi:hypothetical protein